MQQPIRPGLYLGRDDTIRQVEKVGRRVYTYHGLPQSRDIVTYALVNQPKRPVQRRTVLETTFRRWVRCPLVEINQKVPEQLNNEGWKVNLGDPEFQLLLAREALIEDFLNDIDAYMWRHNISRTELADRLEQTEAFVQEVMARKQRLDAETMSDMAFHLGLKIKLRLEKAK